MALLDGLQDILESYNEDRKYQEYKRHGGFWVENIASKKIGGVEVAIYNIFKSGQHKGFELSFTALDYDYSYNRATVQSSTLAPLYKLYNEFELDPNLMQELDFDEDDLPF